MLRRPQFDSDLRTTGGATRSVVGCLVLALLWACGPPSERADGERTVDGASARNGALLVLGASDLLTALEELVPLYENKTDERIQVVLGSTGNLAAQIRNGAPADLFFSANESFLDRLIEAGSIDPGSRHVYAFGRLAIVTPADVVPPTDPTELAHPRYRTVAIANPEHAPYGQAARHALQAAGVWDSVADRVVMGENVTHALQFVRTGNVDAGVVALSLLAAAPGVPLPYRVVDASLHPPIRQVAGAIKGSPREERARAFLAFVLSADGQEILVRHGFESPVSQITGTRERTRKVESLTGNGR